MLNRVSPLKLALAASLAASTLALAQRGMDFPKLQAHIGVIHTCLIPAGQKTGELYTDDGNTVTASGPCQGRGSWVWAERIATSPGVPPTPPNTPGVSDVVDTLRRPSGRLIRTTTNDFQAAAAKATPPTVFTFVFPKGVFANEQQMIARGAGQPVACPTGTIYAAPQQPDAKAPPCIPAQAVAKRFIRTTTNDSGEY